MRAQRGPTQAEHRAAAHAGQATHRRRTWKVVPPSGTGWKSENWGLNISRDMTWLGGTGAVQGRYSKIRQDSCQRKGVEHLAPHDLARCTHGWGRAAVSARGLGVEHLARHGLVGRYREVHGELSGTAKQHIGCIAQRRCLGGSPGRNPAAGCPPQPRPTAQSPSRHSPRTWYHSRVTPPASTPSSPVNTTLRE